MFTRQGILGIVGVGIIGLSLVLLLTRAEYEREEDALRIYELQSAARLREGSIRERLCVSIGSVERNRTRLDELDAARAYRPSVLRCRTSRGHGSAVAVGPRTVVTVAHGAPPGDVVTVESAGRLWSGVVVASDLLKEDVAVIAIVGGTDLPYQPLGQDPEPGEAVIVGGYPGLPALSRGSAPIYARGFDSGPVALGPVLQAHSLRLVSVQIGPGWSGGGVFSLKQRALVGLVSVGIRGRGSVSYYVPVSIIRAALKGAPRP